MFGAPGILGALNYSNLSAATSGVPERTARWALTSHNLPTAGPRPLTFRYWCPTGLQVYKMLLIVGPKVYQSHPLWAVRSLRGRARGHNLVRTTYYLIFLPARPPETWPSIIGKAYSKQHIAWVPQLAPSILPTERPPQSNLFEATCLMRANWG